MPFVKSQSVRQNPDNHLGVLHIYLNHNESAKFSDRQHGQANTQQNKQDEVFVTQLQKIPGLRVSCQKNTTIYEQGKPVQTDLYRIFLSFNELESMQRTLLSIQRDVAPGYNKEELILAVKAVITKRTPQPLKSASASKKPHPPEHSLQKEAATLPHAKPNAAPLQADGNPSSALPPVQPAPASINADETLPAVEPDVASVNADKALPGGTSRMGEGPSPEMQARVTAGLAGIEAFTQVNQAQAPALDAAVRVLRQANHELSQAEPPKAPPSRFLQAINWIRVRLKRMGVKIQRFFSGLFGSKSKQAPAEKSRPEQDKQVGQASTASNPGVFTSFGSTTPADDASVAEFTAKKTAGTDTSLFRRVSP